MTQTTLARFDDDGVVHPLDGPDVPAAAPRVWPDRLWPGAGAGAHIAAALADDAADGVLAVVGDRRAAWAVRATSDGRGRWLVAEVTTPRPEPDVLGVVRDGALAELSHARRSPLVRLSGWVALLRRAFERGGAGGVKTQLDGLATAVDGVLDAADADVEAITRLVAAGAAPAAPAHPVSASCFAAEVRRAVPSRCGPRRAVGPDDAATAVDARVDAAVDAAGGSGGFLDVDAEVVVVTPVPHAGLVGPVSRLLAYLDACRAGVRVRVVTPQLVWTSPLSVARRRTPGSAPSAAGAGGLDAGAESVGTDEVGTDGVGTGSVGTEASLARRWPVAAAPVVDVLADVVTLSRAGVRVVIAGVDDPRRLLRLDAGAGVVGEVDDRAAGLLGPDLGVVRRGREPPTASEAWGA